MYSPGHMPNPVLLVFGGTSSERRVSVASAQHLVSVLGACRSWFIAPDGAVHECSAKDLAQHEQPFERDFQPQSPAFAPGLEQAILGLDDRSTVFVLALHGGAGEDGTIQALFEAQNLAFTGSGSRASAAAFDKSVAKALVAERGVRTVPGFVLHESDAVAMERALRELYGRHGSLVLKPVADGSSVGLHAVLTLADVAGAASAMASQRRAYLAEPFVRGTEVTVGVVDRKGSPHALPPTEIRVEQGRMFDYEGKYLGHGTQEITPAEISETGWEQACQAAIIAHQALGCEGYSRTDLILVDDEPVFLEINTLPGLTRASLIPQELRAEGSTMADFVAEQVEIAVKRRDRLAKS